VQGLECGALNYQATVAGMSRSDAERIFLRHGVSAVGLPRERLRQAWLALGRTHHPDHGGDGRAMREINAAYDALRRTMPEPARRGSPVGPEDEYAVWGFDGQTLTRGPSMICTPEEFHDVADYVLRAMRRGFRYQKAILVQKQGERWEASLIYSAGRHHTPPIRLETRGEPERDVLLLRRLAELTEGVP
jgi:hypothetical protein